MFEKDRKTKKEQSARQDRSRNWPAKNLSTTSGFGVIHHGIRSLTQYAHSLNKENLSQKAVLPLFAGVCPPVLYSRTLTKAQGTMTRTDVLQISSFHLMMRNIPTSEILLLLLAQALIQPI